MSANKEKIKGWVRDRQYTINKDKRDAAFEWLLEVADKGGFNFGVGQIKGHPEEIFLFGRYPLDEHETKRKQLSPQEHKDLLFKMRFRLLSIDINADLEEDLTQLSIKAEIFQEDLTRDRFWQTVRRMSQALHSALWSLDERFDPPTIRGSNGN